MIKIAKNVSIGMTVALMLGCTTLKNNGVNPLPTSDVLLMSDAEYNEYTTSLKKDIGRANNYNIGLYLEGMPAEFGTGDTAYTMHWNKFIGYTMVYHGHVADKFGTGLEQYEITAFAVDNNGVALKKEDGSPYIMFRSSAQQAGMSRTYMQILGQAIGMSLNGAVVAGINAATRCRGDECGGGLTLAPQTWITNDNTNDNAANFDDVCSGGICSE